jgi:hypothetical protein
MTPPPRSKVSGKRLWFGFGAAFLCWFGLGIADVMITWRECLHREQYGTSSSHPGLLVLNIVIFLALLVLAVVAGIVSYRNWRALSAEKGIFSAEATRPYEYLAMLGVIMTITLTVGIIWFGLPLFIIQLCARTR